MKKFAPKASKRAIPESAGVVGKSPSGAVRVETRVQPSVYDTWKRAAKSKGMKMNEFVRLAVDDTARRTLIEAQTLNLSREAQERFAEAIVTPRAPSNRLVAAAKRHAAYARDK